MGELMALLVTSVLVNNVILTQFLGMCPFMGVSKKKSSAIGMGVAVVGGMIFATSLGIFLIPVFFVITEYIAAKMGIFKQAKKKTPADYM